MSFQKFRVILLYWIEHLNYLMEHSHSAFRNPTSRAQFLLWWTEPSDLPDSCTALQLHYARKLGALVRAFVSGIDVRGHFDIWLNNTSSFCWKITMLAFIINIRSYVLWSETSMLLVLYWKTKNWLVSNFQKKKQIMWLAKLLYTIYMCLATILL